MSAPSINTTRTSSMSCGDLDTYSKKTFRLSTSDYRAISFEKCSNIKKNENENSITSKSNSESKILNEKKFGSSSDRPTINRPITSNIANSSDNQKPTTNLSKSAPYTNCAGRHKLTDKYQESKPEYQTDLVGSIDYVANQLRGDITSITDDDVSVISTSILNEENQCIQYMDCSVKEAKEASSTKLLSNSSDYCACVCQRLQEVPCTSTNVPSTDLFGWYVKKKESTDQKTRTAGSKRRPSPPVFVRLSRDDGKDRSYVFKHLKDPSDYMRYYRYDFTVGGAGDLTRPLPVLGRDAPDPYAIKTKVCLITEINPPSPQAVGLVGGKKIQEPHDYSRKRSYPNLSPVRTNNTPCVEDEEQRPTSIAQSCIYINDISCLPSIPHRPASSPSSERRSKTPASGKRKTASDYKFEGEIVGVKHEIPVATICNMSALCKPKVGKDVYEPRQVSGEDKKPNSNRQSQKTKETRSFPNTLTASSTVTTVVVNVNSSNNSEIAGHSNHSSHTGCRGCNRVNSLLQGSRKLIKKPPRARSQSFNQCKPLDNDTLNIQYRLQKMPMG